MGRKLGNKGEKKKGTKGKKSSGFGMSWRYN
jgi:hypothetical protein